MQPNASRRDEGEKEKSMLVAELLMLKTVLELKKKAIMIFPFVSIAREKLFGLKKLLRDSHVRVGGFMGTQHPKGNFENYDLSY